MLVTSSQISVAISSGVVFIFTSLLFLSGYVLQQQTIHSLQTVIRPAVHSPTPPPPVANPVLAKHFGRPPGHSFYDKYLASNRPAGGWAKVAYVSLVRQHVEVCNAVMGMMKLSAEESMAQRVIMYPREWDEEDVDKTNHPTSEGEEDMRQRRTSRRLLRQTAKEYKVMLQPISSSTDTARSGAVKGEEKDERNQKWKPEEEYPLTNLISLITFNRIVYFPPSGLILDATPLDLLFTLPVEEDKKGMLGLFDPRGRPSDEEGGQRKKRGDSSGLDPDILILEPSKKLYQDTAAALPEGAFEDKEFYGLVHMAPAATSGDEKNSGKDEGALVVDTGRLGDADAQFEASEVMERTAYVRLRDADVPGPEFDVPRWLMEQKAPPGAGEARKAWFGVYEKYWGERMSVCGLDLEPWTMPQKSKGGEEL